jgi:hypothetical protein
MEAILFLDLLTLRIIPFQYLMYGVKKPKISLEFNQEDCIKMLHTYLVMIIIPQIA